MIQTIQRKKLSQNAPELSIQRLQQQLNQARAEIKELKISLSSDQDRKSFSQTISRIHYELSGAPKYYRDRAREIELKINDPSVEVKNLLLEATSLVYCSTNFASFIKGMLETLNHESHQAIGRA